MGRHGRESVTLDQLYGADEQRFVGLCASRPEGTTTRDAQQRFAWSMKHAQLIAVRCYTRHLVTRGKRGTQFIYSPLPGKGL